MLAVLRDVNGPYQKFSPFSYTLSLFGVWPYRIFLTFLLLFYLIIVILGLDFLPPTVHPNVLGLAIFFLIKFICYLSKKKKKKKFPTSQTFQSPWVQSTSRGHVPLVKPTTYLIHAMWTHDMGLGFIRIKRHDALRDPQGSSSLKMEFYLSVDEVPYLIAFHLFFFFFSFFLLLLIFWFRAQYPILVYWD